VLAGSVTTLKLAAGAVTADTIAANAITANKLSSITVEATKNITVGTAAVSGTTMTGSGAVLNGDGTAAIGNATTNISFNGTQITLNGSVVKTNNIPLKAVTEPQVKSSPGASTSDTIVLTEATPVLVWGVCSGVLLVSGGCTIRLYLNGVEEKQTFSNSAGGVIPTITLPIIDYGVVSAGPHTITCDVRDSSGNYAPAVETTVVVMECKR